MSDGTENTRPRVTMPAPTSAGGEAAQEAAQALRGLAFDPHVFTVGEPLKEALEGVDTVRMLNRLQAFDSRITAAGYYERRIKELAEKAEEA